jgi:nicotinate-nucleotide pyrophosphorylase (carboxylating)
MTRDFHQTDWDERVADDCRQLVRLAVREDLDRRFDWTTLALAPPETACSVAIVAREAGVLAGLPAARLALEEMGVAAKWETHRSDGDRVAPGDSVAQITGSARDLLTAERLMLNLIGRLSGVATHTRRYVEAIDGTEARIYDTRKTTPGWRRLEKYAVRCGGGHNHRTGLFDAVLIKDNHLALAAHRADSPLSPAQAVEAARQFVASMALDSDEAAMIIEVEVDTLDQLADVLSVAPDIVLLDNMSLDELGQAVAMRDQRAPKVQLEASGGVNLDTVWPIAKTGVNRISVGDLTHGSVWLDFGLDWR